MKQISKVLEAIGAGALTARDAAWVVGISKKAAAARLSELETCGLVERVGIVRRVSGGPGRQPRAYRVAAMAVVIAALSCVAVRADQITFGAGYGGEMSSRVSGGGGGELRGYMAPTLISANFGSTPRSRCFCSLDFATGPAGLDSWDFAGGGEILWTGSVEPDDPYGAGVPDVPPAVTLMTGTMDDVKVIRCDAFDPGELCVFGGFRGTLDPELAKTYGILPEVTGFFNVVYLVEYDFSETPGCVAQESLSCGPFAPAHFSAVGVGPGGGVVVISGTAVPEPASWFLLAGVFAFCAIIAKKGEK